eukprot:Gb_11255 [translate_table: standard]
MPRKTANLKWQKLPEHRNLKGRAGHTTTLVGKQFFVLGGRNGNEFFNDLWVFDIEVEQWKQLQQKVPFAPRAYHTATLIGDQYMWVIGGSDKTTMFDDVHVLNTITLQWSSPTISGSIAIRRRGTHAAVLHPLQSRSILIHGGYGGTNPQWLDDLSLLRTDSLDWVVLNPGGAVPCARGYHTLTTIGAYAVLFGGKNDVGIVKEDYLSIFDVATNEWAIPKVQGQAPIPRSNHAATLMDNDLIIIHGGRHGALRLSDTCVLQVPRSPVSSISTLYMKWHIVEKANISPNARQSLEKRGILAEVDSPHGRSAHSLIARDRALYIFGGYGGQGLTFNDIFVLRNFPHLPGMEQPNMCNTVSNAAQTPILVADNSDEDNAQCWRSTKRPKHETCQHHKSVPRLQEMGQIMNRRLDTSPLRNQDGVEDSRLQLQQSGNELRQQSCHPPQAQAVSNLQDKTLAMMTKEKDMFEKEVTNLQQQLTSLKENLEEKMYIEVELRADKVHLQQDIDSMDEKIEDLKNVIEVLEKKVQLTSQKTKSLESENENLKAQVQGLRSSLEDKERQSVEAAQEAKAAQQKCEKLEGSLDNVRSFCSEVVHERDEYKACVQKLESELEKKMQALQQLSLKFENEKAFLSSEVVERKATTDKLLTDLGMFKESARTLTETVDRQSKQLEDIKSTAGVLQKEKDKLSQSNAVLVAENRQLLASRDSANANFDFLKSELQSTRGLSDQNAAEVIRLKNNVEQSKEHIASLHESLKKSEENIKTKHKEIERLRAVINEVEQFEQIQMIALQQHLEKVRCARQSCPL